jgi:hypothetical protein
MLLDGTKGVEYRDAIERAYEIPGQTWPTELTWLFDNLKNSKTHAEVGVYCGRSLFASCGGMSHTTVYLVDYDFPSLPGSKMPGPNWIRGVRDATLVAMSAENSSLTFEEFRFGSMDAARALFNRGILLDSVWIDASHEYEHVSGDIQAWREIVKPGGLICGHDYWPVHVGVMRAVNENFRNFEVPANTRIWFARL